MKASCFTSVLLLWALARPCAAADVLLRESVQVTGGRATQSFAREIEVKDARPVLITVRERGANVTLTVVSKDSGQPRWLVDSPIDRGGLLAVVIVPPDGGPASRFTLLITSQDPAGYAGAIDMQARRLTSDSALALGAWRRHMNAGLTYAQVERIRADPTLQRDRIPQLIDAAAQDYANAAAGARTAGEVALFAQATLHRAWVAFEEQHDYVACIELTSTARAAMQQLRDEYGASRALSLRAAAMRDRASSLRKSAATVALPREVSARFAEAVRQFRAVEEFHGSRVQRFEQAQAINNIGLSYYLEGRYREALAEYERAADLFRLIADTPNQARSIQNAALVEFELGNLRACYTMYARARAAFNRVDDLQLYGDLLNNSALCMYVQGKFDEALQYYEEAFEIQTQLDNKSELARTLHGTGSTYYSMGEHPAALGYYQRALELRKQLPDARGHAATLNARGNVECALRASESAVQHYSASLELAVSPTTRARTQLRLARCLVLGGQIAAASLKLQEIRRDSVAGSTVDALLMLEEGRLAAAQKRWTEVRRKLDAALPVLERYELTDEQSEALVMLASAARATGALEAALRYAERGIKQAEELRGRSRNPELRAALFAPWRKFYDMKIELLLGSAAAPELARQSLQAAEQGRFRALEEVLQVSTQGASPPLPDAQRAELLAELTEKRVQLAVRIDRSGSEDERAKYLLSDIARLRTKLDAGSMSSAPVHSARAIALLDSKVPADTAVVEYWLGEERAYAWVLTDQGLQTYALPAPAVISAAAMQAHAALSSSRRDPGLSRLLRTLSDLLLAPLKPLDGKRRWVFIVDGALHSLPFAVLPEPGSDTPAIVAHEIAVAPALRLLEVNSGTPRPIKSALLVADPVFDAADERLASVVSGPRRSGFDTARLPRLTQSAVEIENIAAHLSQVRISRLTGFGAARDDLLAALRSPVDLLHLATHGRSDTEFPQLSALVLSRYDAQGRRRNPWVHAAELRSMGFNGSYVVLSACEGAAGKRVAGEGLVGLSYSLLAAGARGVVASSWRVADAASAAYMDAFYESLSKHPDMTLAAAHAARSLLTSGRWNDPRYWGSFVAFEKALRR